MIKEKRFSWIKKAKRGKYICYRNLNSLRIAKLKNARDEYSFHKVWSSDGRIMVMEEGSAKPEVIYGCLCCVESMIVLRFALWKET